MASRNPVFCRDCKWSRTEDGKAKSWSLRCVNPIVNSKDSWALSYGYTEGEGYSSFGSGCREERELGFFQFPACGIKGKLYEPR